MKLFISFALILITVGCTPKLDIQVLELLNGKNLWLEKVKDQNYSYDFVPSCFCRLNGKKITVISGFNNVISATTLDGTVVGKGEVRSMKQLYEEIFSHLEEQASSKGVSVNVKYNKEYGYPYEIKFRGAAADLGYTFEISNIKILGSKNGI